MDSSVSSSSISGISTLGSDITEDSTEPQEVARLGGSHRNVLRQSSPDLDIAALHALEIYAVADRLAIEKTRTKLLDRLSNMQT